MKKLALTLCLSFFLFQSYAQSITPQQLVNRAIAFHDPDGWWSKVKMEYVIEMESPKITPRTSHVVIDNIKGGFHLSVLRGGRLLEWMVDGEGNGDFKLNFTKPTTPEQADSLSLTEDRARWWRDYYTFLYGMPMKLTEEGTVIGNEVIETTFMDQEVLAVRVTFDESIGKDIWYYYFNPNTYAMVGYRFYHDEAKNDGEYIVLSDMIIEQGLRIPKDRAWYTNAEDELLGTDRLISFKVDRGW
ncbi:DUF6503 family protein [Roseivirga misakiensis]|uniref:Outer membrane lipoprotein-sorting protein n=1 Tax=Roseivirga misakiensis TaxID=1563681 RepID=A0A1E5T5B0_9BACT|nr:DUF6503 family protein [Roseivirga misakiensis]OEK06559.1 hypothetical protein BFP71_02490 [Roseivirga misakiensis]